MAEYLLELYVSRTDGDAVERAAGRGRTVAGELTREGTPVRYVRSIFVPEDETCFFLFEAPSMDAVKEVARRAALQFERVSAAATEPAAVKDDGGSSAPFPTACTSRSQPAERSSPRRWSSATRTKA